MPTTWLTGAFQWPSWASSCCLGLLVCLLSLHTIEKLFAFANFQRQYLVVYGLVMFADWLQGTHMYSLYQSYDMNVGALFLTGFLSSVVFGNLVGPLVDKYGRRKACLVYCALEIVINILEHIPIMAVLLAGRVMGGISTSLLFSAFESWMVTEHRRRGFANSLLGKTFAHGSEINGVVAVIAGLIAQITADVFGDIGPFRAVVIVTAIAAAFVFSWSENYGSPTKDSREEIRKLDNSEDSRVTADSGMLADSYALGCCYSLFEGAMYVFVFLWYPTLEAVVPSGELPSGLVFSSFMLCIAIGGKLFNLVDNSCVREELLLLVTATISSISLLIPTVSENYQYILGGFLVFEVCVGLLSPCCATLRSKYFPKADLCTTLSLFRLPTNILVVLGTAGASYFTSDQLYYGCSAVLVVATGCAAKLVRSSSITSTPRRNRKAQ
ncbi:Major Facilitator Superfamily (MFS) [Phytophthora infestans T30-4]|uniref:Molybdate-anion transporter n=1 Tax=Phytophthora infestans (strain T30-4) TaxID=403677 RepID=D0MZJ2_PHYIT|nr:Major Facilitator Superfamily (MFS) [Phytophthora infestans T30-4]EEY65655.1 Major Facilitator Superfamily (MFS) [Phytophthora infestans T30-4]|eukprot:XP_002906254.1 Major Facilitator Superfamily (MFS) [Phytophthora infestans T30-4]